MFADDEAKLAQMMADIERIRKLLRDSDRLAEQSRQQPADAGREQSHSDDGTAG